MISNRMTDSVGLRLQPGRACSKQDFKDFAESLVENAQFTKAEDAKRSA